MKNTEKSAAILLIFSWGVVAAAAVRMLLVLVLPDMFGWDWWVLVAFLGWLSILVLES